MRAAASADRRPGIGLREARRRELVERRSSLAFIFPLPGRSRTLCDRLSCKFSGVSWTKGGCSRAARGLHASDFFRSVFVVRSRQRFEPCSSAGAEASASPHRKWSAQLSYFATMTEMDRQHKRSARKFFAGLVRRESELPGAPTSDADCSAQVERSKHEFRQRQRRGRRAGRFWTRSSRRSRVNAPAYGADDYTARAQALLSEVFETKVAAFLVATGTAANALALSALVNALGRGFLPRGSAYPRRRMRRAGVLHRRREAGRHPGGGRQDHARGPARDAGAVSARARQVCRSRARCRSPRRPKPGRSTALERGR